MNKLEKSFSLCLSFFTSFGWCTLNGNNSDIEETEVSYSVPEHDYNENFEQDLVSLCKNLKKEATKNKIITKKIDGSPKIEVNPYFTESLLTPQGIAIGGKELDLANSVLKVKNNQYRKHSATYIYRSIPHHQGVWEFTNLNKINFKGKRVALIVHGHSTNSLLKALSEYWATKIQKPLSCIMPVSETNRIKANDYYGLDTLINLGRMLSEDIYDKNGKHRYDYVVGYSYSSWGYLEELCKQFAQDINNSGLQEAEGVDLFAHSMGGLVSRGALEREGLGAWIFNFVSLASPHQGVPFCLIPGVIEITPTPLISTTDLITRNLILDEHASDFIKGLSFNKSLYSSLANYHTLGGTQYNTLTWSGLKEGKRPKPYDLCPGVVIQKYLDCRFGNGKIKCDGLVPLYSAHSQILKNKSYRYHSDKYPDPIDLTLENREDFWKAIMLGAENDLFDREDYPHAFTLPLDHRTITGDDLEPTLFDITKTK